MENFVRRDGYGDVENKVDGFSKEIYKTKNKYNFFVVFMYGKKHSKTSF